MQDAIADSTSRLADLLDRIRTETDQVRSDELATEIRRILEERAVIEKPLGEASSDFRN